jgi:eukaryotic-like serine/threonine-protein kinase
MKDSLIIFYFLFILASAQAQTREDEWPLFRGKSDLAGKSESEFPSPPVLLWSISTGSKTKSSPVISNGTIFFGNEKGILTAVTTRGKILWTFDGTSPVDAAPMVYGKKVIFGSNDGAVKALDRISGKLLWSYSTDNQIAGSANVWSSGNKSGIVVGSYDYFLHCIDPETGKLLWKVETENYINGTPSISNGRIVFGGCDGMIRIVDPLTGQQSDTIEIGVYIASSPALSNGFAYFGDYNGNKYCINLNSRKIVWKIAAREESGAVMGIPAIGSSAIVIGSEDKYIYCYEAKDGKLRWKFRTNGRVVSSAVMTETKVLATGMDGYVYILNLDDGKKIWSFNAGTPMSSSPAVVKGRFYILTEDGRLLAFADKTESIK